MRCAGKGDGPDLKTEETTMISRDAVAVILGRGHSMVDGHEILGNLEEAGYRVVRAGMVPQFDDLDDVAAMLSRLGSWGGQVQHNSIRARDASTTIRQLRDLAVLVLRIDPDAIDQTSE